MPNMVESGKEYKWRKYFKKTKNTENKTNNKFSVQRLTSTHLSISKEQLLSCSMLSYPCYYLSKSLKTYAVVNTNINDDKSCKVCTVAEFDYLP